ncbi:uncharacterized protein LOC125245092 isoform X1 [Megalobrama amblycephala]|uniref:uncharacterized protein LOC125245092 isoform X1 n=1 Tax=Megalobrama amblycephala TaxID=75352 RepID=UPI002013C8E4|nr:uncharacterized protein LOC125245092 isoform X1 [Megalobrama amblycephala]XP_048011497.1 uncharacterized protein LOC125245092 isoform X1 [Megalobrama amblycephala]
MSLRVSPRRLMHLGKSAVGAVLAWRKSIINHLYWCASTSKTGQEAVEKWKSVTYHMQNVHHHNSDLFPVCTHPPLEMRAWLTPSTKACERFCDLMLHQRLLKDVGKLSRHRQPSSVEGFHSLILKFAPKNVAFSFLGMLNRLLLAAFHYNENANREPSVRVKWPKYKKGEHSIHYVKTAPTYNYVETMLRLLFEEVVFNPGPYQELINELKVPDHLCAAFDRPDLQESGARPWSRFSQMEQEPF